MNLLSKPYAGWATAWNSNEFFRARIKLTVLYIVILAVVLTIVSVLLLLGVSRRLDEAATEENIRVSLEQAESIAMNMKPGQPVESALLEREFGRLHYSVEFVNGEEVKVDPFTGRGFLEDETFQSFQETFYADFEEMLLVIDLILLLVTAACSYFLAGKTLQPIAEKMRQQREFSANAAHELRNPLAAIRSSAESALHATKADAEEYRGVFQDIVHVVEQLIGVSEQLLALSRFDEGGMKKAKVPFHTFITDVIRTVTPLAEKKQITIRHELAPCTLEGDASGLKQLVFNLLHNAIKFSPSGSDVRIALTTDGTLSVEDHGRGIEAHEIPKLFDRFYTVDASRGGEETGSGLGLALVQSIAHAHGAKVSVQSIPEQGSTFTVSFPNFS